ncbi:relaxase/mobilization nuclease domain-containing protein [Desulfovibrio sp. OttesenSCG-928-G11]|nr:relaxase/mobilization nuclease domain-containing protein [Desulfovibrio sp. OttesenSCG-928-G11]
MLIKVFDTGQGAGFGPVEYVCSPNPFGRGLRQVTPQILKGDANMMRLQIDAVPFAWKYTSGVVSFASEDAPTEDQQAEIMDDFEALAFSGLPLSSKSILWVRHKHAGRTELHFVIPRQEVHSGKSFNSHPPGWEKKYDLLRDKYNYKYGWARPDDLRRARPVQSGTTALINADCKRRGTIPPSDPKTEVTEKLIVLIEQGEIRSREDIVQTLRGMGYELPRIGKDYLTILDPDTGKRTRLKGTIYFSDFSPAEWLDHRDARKSINDVPDMAKFSQAASALQAAIVKTAAYNKMRYLLPENIDPAQPEQPAPVSMAAALSKENPHDKAIHFSRLATSSLSGRRPGKSPASLGRARDYHKAHQPRQQRNTSKRFLSALYQHHPGAYNHDGTITERMQKGNSDNASHPARNGLLLEASNHGGQLYAGYRQTACGVSGRTNICFGTCLSSVGRIAGGQSQTFRRHDDAHFGRYQWPKNEAGIIGKQGHHAVHQACSSWRQFPVRKRLRLSPSNLKPEQSGNQSLVKNIRVQAEVLAGIVTTQALSGALRLNHWYTGMGSALPAPSQDTVLDKIRNQVEALAVHSGLIAVSLSLTGKCWQAGTIMTHSAVQQILGASCLKKAEAVTEQVFMTAFAEQVQAQHWLQPLSRLLPLPVITHILWDDIVAQAAQLATETTLDRIGQAQIADLWQPATTVKLSLFPAGQGAELVEQCAAKAGKALSAISIAAIGEAFGRQSWNCLERPLATAQKHPALVEGIVKQARHLASCITVEHDCQNMLDIRLRCLAQTLPFISPESEKNLVKTCASKAVNFCEAFAVTALATQLQEGKWSALVRALPQMHAQDIFLAKDIIAQCHTLSDKLAVQAAGHIFDLRRKAGMEAKRKRIEKQRLRALFSKLHKAFIRGDLPFGEFERQCRANPYLWQQYSQYAQMLANREEKRRERVTLALTTRTAERVVPGEKTSAQSAPLSRSTDKSIGNNVVEGGGPTANPQPQRTTPANNLHVGPR